MIKGGIPLRGSVEVNGAKNAALPVLAAAVLSKYPVTLRRVPAIRDVKVMLEILRLLGVRAEERTTSNGLELIVQSDQLRTCEIEESLMRKMRSSIFLMGALLGRIKEVRVSHPGGCAIGPRPIDMHLRGLKALGVRVLEEGGYIHATTTGLRGAEVSLDYPSVGATENIMMAAVLAEGTTVIKNAAREPEIKDVADFLNKLGARISGAGGDTIVIEGVSSLGGGDHRIISDRIEAGSYAVAAAITQGDVLLKGAVSTHMDAVLAKLKEVGASIETGEGWVRVRGPKRIRAIDIKTLPYPGFPTDMQNQFMALCCIADGTSMITETVFENRFKVAEEFGRMGADIKVYGRTAVIKGVRRLSGAIVQALDDLRGSAALVLAGLGAQGTTTVEGADPLERGYQDFKENLRNLGADINGEEMAVAGSG